MTITKNIRNRLLIYAFEMLFIFLICSLPIISACLIGSGTLCFVVLKVRFLALSKDILCPTLTKTGLVAFAEPRKASPQTESSLGCFINSSWPGYKSLQCSRRSSLDFLAVISPGSEK